MGVLFNVLGMIFALVCISLVGFFVWAHHLFTVGLDVDARAYFSSVSLLIALPTSIKVFSWLVTFLRCMCLSSVLLLICGFLLMFFLGGVTGLVLANCDIDLLMHDSYFVVSHFHFVLSLGAVFGFLCGLCYVYHLNVGLFPACFSLRLSVFFAGVWVFQCVLTVAWVWSPRVSASCSGLCGSVSWCCWAYQFWSQGGGVVPGRGWQYGVCGWVFCWCCVVIFVVFSSFGASLMLLSAQCLWSGLISCLLA